MLRLGIEIHERSDVAPRHEGAEYAPLQLFVQEVY
jgi:hypothetical protein